MNNCQFLTCERLPRRNYKMAFICCFLLYLMLAPCWGQEQVTSVTQHKVNNIQEDIKRFFNESEKDIEEFVKTKINIHVPPSTNFLLFLCSLVFAMFWITYITFWNSRLMGTFATKIANNFVREGYIKVGSVSFSVMAGKVMFRDFAYITPDYTIRTMDGFILFRWWRSYEKREVTEDLSHSDTRLSMQLNGFEYHHYNRSRVYQELEKKFGLEPRIIPPDDEDHGEEVQENEDEVETSEYILGKDWRDLIPVIKVDISTGKFAFGNKLLPTTLLVAVEEAHFTYSTKPANSNLDHFMHFVKCTAENTKVIMAESPKYTGLRVHDEAPRYMGEGFVVLSSNTVNFYYYMDEPGLVPERTEMLCLPNGDMVEPAPPSWGLDIHCGKGTDFSYGPWADRQRESLYKFFFPPDYQPLKVNPIAKPGDKREPKKFDIRLSTLNEATIDILFSKQKETNAIHLNIEQGSFFEMNIPWIVEDERGYKTTLNGTLMNVEGTTSLAFRDLLQCETLEFQIDMMYPAYWNSHQEWNYAFTLSKATGNFVFAHKWFFQDMVDDWGSHSPPDLMTFVPYTWNFKFLLNDFELLTIANEFNWIDTASSNPENSHLAICGKFLQLDFSLPFYEFLPDVIPFVFRVTGETLDLSTDLPETNTSHDILTSLDKSVLQVGRDGKHEWKKDGQTGKWRRKCQYSDGWIDCWSVPNLVLTIDFLFHPIPMAGPAPQADVTTPDKEDDLLGPLRMNAIPGKASDTVSEHSAKTVEFDPCSLKPDLCKVELEVGPSVIFLYGTLIRNFMHMKENLFGEDQQYTAMDADTSKPATAKVEKEKEFDMRDFRPLDVILDITVHDLQANLVKYCTENEPPCPFLSVEKLVFEMDKSFRETRLQLLLSPVLLTSLDQLDRNEKDHHLRQGNFMLSGLQFRGHACFSELDRPLGADTLEYAWLMEIQCGSLIGRMTIPQVYNVVVALETLLYLTVDKENVMKHPRPYKICQHDRNQKECIESHEDVLCPTVGDVKYEMVRFNLDLVDINIVEKTTSLNLQACPVRLASCNLHGQQTMQGITAIIKNIELRQYIATNKKIDRYDTNISHHPDIWVEAGAIKIGPIYVEGALAKHGIKNPNFQINQHCFLQKHDRKTKKLWFLWPQAITKVAAQGKCGCSGGCTFFGKNENGPTFFKPSRDDLKKHLNIALFSIKNRRENPGYGQSILHDDYLVLDNCLSYVGSTKVLTEGVLHETWPLKCHQPNKLPYCGSFKQPRSQMSNNSSGGPDITPRMLRRQKTIGKRSMPTTPIGGSHGGSVRRKKASSESGRKISQSREVFNNGADPGKDVLQKTSSMIEVKEDGPFSLPAMVRTESLISEALSFYSLDGDNRSSKPSLMNSPQPQQSPRSSVHQSPRSSVTSPRGSRMHSPRDSLQREVLVEKTPSPQSDTTTIHQHMPDIEDLGSDPDENLGMESDDEKVELRKNIRKVDSEPSLSRSISSSSYISAVDIEQDDYNLVSLHQQVNKPITDSVLLMRSYLCHLTQLRCQHWDTDFGTLSKKTSGANKPDILKQFPKFEVLEEGFNSINMYDNDLGDSVKDGPITTPSHPQGFSWGSEIFNSVDTDSEQDDPSDLHKKTLRNTICDGNTSKSTIIVQFRGAVDIILSPILLESLQRYLEAITPTLELLHPLAVINHLHFNSVDRVEAKNTLKKEKSLDLQEKAVFSDTKSPESKSKSQGASVQTVTRIFEKSVSSAVQASLHLPKINVMSLQASVVEDKCDFSALDNVRDITCVSLVSLGIQESSFQFYKTSQSKKIVQVLSQNNRIPTGKKKKAKYKVTQPLMEPLSFESSETQLEEIMLMASVNKIHGQLRRLKNDTSLLSDAYITSVPNHKSQVFFEHRDVPKLSSFNSLSDLGDIDSKGRAELGQVHPLGFNMCETGMEGIQIKIGRKSTSSENDLKEMDETAKIHTETEITSSTSKDTFTEHLDTPDTENIVPETLLTDEIVPNSILKNKNEKISIKTDSEVIENVDKPESHGKKSSMSASATIKTVWFNFAAPPKIPISKKMDFTKLDWNLLSTGSPACEAWMNPIDRLQYAGSNMYSRYNCRVGSIMAAAMADALDDTTVHFPKVSKYENLTALSKTLKEDPSCQMCLVLLRFVQKIGMPAMNANLDTKAIPPLTTLRQGIVVLSRQWKNVIYTPILIEYNMKTSGLMNLYHNEMELGPIDETEETSDEEDGFSELETDDETYLLKNTNLNKVRLKETDGSIVSNMSYFINRGVKSPHRSPNAEDMIGTSENGLRQAKSFDNRGSIYSDDSGQLQSGRSDKIFSSGGSPTTKKSGKEKLHVGVDDEDLYSWMKRQQAQADTNKEKASSLKRTNFSPSSNSDNAEKSIKIQIEEEQVKAKQPIDQPTAFLDAHIIFEPLLSSLGLMPQQITNLSLKNLGSQVKITGGIDVFKIDIIESGFGKLAKKGRSSRHPNLVIDTDSSPAFLCEKISLTIDFKKITDFLRGEKPGKGKVLPLYVSRNQLKRHTSSFAHCILEINFISQKVNMPLLRLLSQIVSMHQNVIARGEVLKEKKPSLTRIDTYRKHKKSSSGSSASETISVTLRPDDLSIGGSSVNLTASTAPSVVKPSSSIQTPSPSANVKQQTKFSRPRSFASKFRANSRLGGYSNLGESPIQEQQDSFILTRGVPLEKISEEQVTKCWKTLYHLLDLYATLPETKIVNQRNSITPMTIDETLMPRPKVVTEESIIQKGRRYAQSKVDQLKTPDIETPAVLKLHSPLKTSQTKPSPLKKEVSFARTAGHHEHMPLIVTGEAKINKVKLMATLSGLKLEGEIDGLKSSFHYKEKIKSTQKSGSIEAQVNGDVRETSIVLLEGALPKQQTVVKVTIGKSNTLYTSQMWKTRNDKNYGHLHIGPVHVDIPQHPVNLHGIMARSTKQITSTLMEFKGTRILHRGKTSTTEDVDFSGHHNSPKILDSLSAKHEHEEVSVEESHLIKPLVMTFELVIQSFAVSAALLPSLQAQYKMETVKSNGVTGSKAKFEVNLPKHTLSFRTSVDSDPDAEITLPSAASIDLPKVYVLAQYIQDETPVPGTLPKRTSDGAMYSKGNYFNAEAEIGELDHCLTTDMLNHLVFVQKVFMKEVNEVVQKMSGGDRLVPVWSEFGQEFEFHHSAPRQQLLYSISVRLKRITITATTPTNSAVRFETGTSELLLSNRIENVQGSKLGSNKISTRAKVHLKLSLGQLIRDEIYLEAESQFQTHAYFKTTIQLRNAYEEESEMDAPDLPDKEVVIINLIRPLIFLKPIAIDRGILVWLSYKNAWEYWAEQRSNLNKEVLIATQQVIDRVPITLIKEQISSQHVGTLFLQLNVQDIGVAIPLTADVYDAWGLNRDGESRGAIVATVDTTTISSCSAKSMVSKGKFVDLCVRFSEDFNHTLDDWKPDKGDDNLMNLCLVSEGSYEVCSRTVKATRDDSTGAEDNAKWILNIQWQMTGVDVHVDTDIGKHLSSLGHTLTSITGDEEEEEESDESSVLSDETASGEVVIEDARDLPRRQKTIQISNLPDFVFDPNISATQMTKMMEREMTEQAKAIDDLRKLGASEHTINQELKKLSDMETFASKHFRRDIIQKLRRQSQRTQSIKEKFGLGPGIGNTPAPQRGMSITKKTPFLPSPTSENSQYSFLDTVQTRLVAEASKVCNNEDQTPQSSILNTGLTTGLDSRERKISLFKSRCDTIEEDISFTEKVRGTTSPRSGGTTSPRTGGTTSPKSLPVHGMGEKKQAEPNVDLEFDFKIFFNYGKCVLHTMKEDDTKKSKKDKSYSGNVFHDNNGSPLSNRKYRASTKSNYSSVRMGEKGFSPAPGYLENTSIFYIPGLDVKVHYISKTESEYDISIISPDESNTSHQLHRDNSFFAMTKRGTNKKATLSTWITLQSIPEETIITPTILEFLEQALEPIPILNSSKAQVSQDQINKFDDMTGIPGGSMVVSSSFPVDVIVYFHMKTNTFRFSSLPVSRVECMLTLPSLDLVFSSKRLDTEVKEEKEVSLYAIPRTRPTSNIEEKSETEGGGGLSVTGCLADFSVHVFHPYGGGRKKRWEESDYSPHTADDRKDSLSINVAFVKFHLSRSRKKNFSKVFKDPNAKLSKQSSNEDSVNNVRFSTIVDIGKASFNYDMRRLTEILAFPKAWYRRTLVRRLFLGELTTTNMYCDGDSPSETHFEAGSNVQFSQKADQNIAPTPSSIGRKTSVVGTPNTKRQSISLLPETGKKKSIDEQTSQQWETLVLFAIKFNELKVGMNMGNVMGNVTWVSKDFKSEGRLSIGSTGHKNMFIGLGLRGSCLDAKGGIIGGCIELGHIDTYCHLIEDSGAEPNHKIGARLDAMEVRFDYMGTSVLMARVSHMEVSLKNEWQVTGTDRSGRESSAGDGVAGTTRSAMVFVFGDLKWDQLQLMISKSTTADLFKIYYKLEEFFVQQFKSSKRVFSSLDTWSTSAAARGLTGSKLGRRSGSSFRSNASTTVSHHRHWQRVLQKISGLKLKTLSFHLPSTGTILGGTFEMTGKHISLACFHGINFKAKSWALFSMKEPFISFNSEAQGIEIDGARATNIVQNLVFSLGVNESMHTAQHTSMATVCKISRNYMYSPQFKTLADWFSYAFSSSTLDQVDRFPVVGTSEPKPSHRTGSQFAHTTELIFALPCLRTDLKTDHIQDEKVPTQDDPRPTVTCSFVTEFEEHILVTVDAEAFFFLHDLITSYMKEKTRALSSQVSQSGGAAGSSLSPQSAGATPTPTPTDQTEKEKNKTEAEESATTPIDPLSNDWRIFDCKTWHLEPTVRLQSWAGRKIEPYGVDYILQKLGFSHAKTTIPKWLQRGCMDPLDKILSLILLRAVNIVMDETDADDLRKKKSSIIVTKSESFEDSATKKHSAVRSNKQ